MRFWVLLSASACSFGQTTFYTGALGGISTVSADGRSTASATEISLYKPENGPAATLFAGAHISDYLAIQGNYIWNRNDLLLSSISGHDAYEQARSSAQHSLSTDLLVYFRNRQSWVRPFLSTGFGVVRFSSAEQRLNFVRGRLRPPPPEFDSIHLLVRFAVGIDFSLGAGWAFRYSFLESIQRNTVSRQLSPPGERNLATFQNLFGFVKSF